MYFFKRNYFNESQIDFIHSMNLLGKKLWMILVIFMAVLLMIGLLLYIKVDIRAIAILTIITGYITKLFSGLSLLVSSIPVIGPVIIKVISLPAVWLMNGLGYFTSLFAIKKGYGKEMMNHRAISIVLLIGIILGYILGYLVPLN